MSSTTAIRCAGDDRKPGCNQPIIAVVSGELHAMKGSEILSFDRLGRARVLCVCGAITITKGQTVPTR